MAGESISDIIEEVSPYYKSRIKDKKSGKTDSVAEVEHKLVYDSSSETIEPIYFYIIDLMTNMGLNPEKLIDNFTASPGSQHFGELGQRKSIMQQQASKSLADIGVVMRGVLNLIYDLKDFKIRLEHYSNLSSDNPDTKQSALFSLKQVWIDKVDALSGGSSISMMARQLGFETLFDAFKVVKDVKDVDDLDLNDRVKRILKSKINEFNIWMSQSEAELRKRYEIERSYLKTQVNTLKIYSRWAKPYLKIAQDLESQEIGRNPALVKAFNTVVLELTLLGKKEFDVAGAVAGGDLPKEFADEKFIKSLKRKYHNCVLVSFTFRAIPRQGTFIGRADVSFKAYALNDDELEKLEEKLGESDLEDVLRLIEGATEESMKQLQKDIEEFLEEPDILEKSSSSVSKTGTNPFLALIGRYNKKPEKKKKEKSEEEPKKTDKEKEKPVKKDSYIEKEFIRKMAVKDAIETAFTLFDVYKKAHGMPSWRLSEIRVV